ncbi:LysR family transcriptional regulator [Rhizobium sp. HT1-10]|uniref:LysR family transcriptional regulator n=1 Tax=Rhizobium sp. HT1-10 TaxID=3111638 RepID=UPI003C275F9C
MDVSSLEIFLAVVAENSVTRAAKLIGRVPSNVTIRIQQLEADLGVVLFSREGKKMTLTKEGRTFLSYANRLTLLAREARLAVKPSGPAGSLRVGTMESTAASRLPAVLSQFNQLWPTVAVRLTMGASRDLTRAVIAEELDCALIARLPNHLLDSKSSQDPELDELETLKAYVEELVVVLPVGHPSIRKATDLRVETLAALEPGCTYRRIAEDWTRSSGSVATLELNSYHAILASVTTGKSAGVMPRSVYDLMSWPSGIATHPLGKVDTLLIHKKLEYSPAIEVFRDIILSSEYASSDTLIAVQAT